MNTQPIARQLLTLVSVMRSIADATVINYRRQAAELKPEYQQAALDLIAAREAELDAGFAAIRAEIECLTDS
jgi:hypothetical protein